MKEKLKEYKFRNFDLFYYGFITGSMKTIVIGVCIAILIVLLKGTF